MTTHDEQEPAAVPAGEGTMPDAAVSFNDRVQAVERLPLDQRAGEFDALHDVLRDELEAGSERVE